MTATEQAATHPRSVVGVPFSAEPGTGPMTWGQLHIWRPMRWFGDTSAAFNISRVVVPDGDPMPVTVVREGFRRLVEAHQILRTRFLDDAGGPRQIVAGTGVYPIEVEQIGDADPDATAEQIARRLAGTPFRLGQEWPVRLGLACRDDRVHAVAVVASHVALDGWGIERLTGFLAESLAGEPVDLSPSWQPLDQAEYEQSERGRRQDAKAMAYWRARLTELPDVPPSRPRLAPSDPAVQSWSYRSNELARASMLIAARSHTSSSAVLLTLAAAVLRAIRGESTTAVQLISANRYTSRQQRLLSAAAQDGLLIFHDEDVTLDTAVQAVYRRATEGYFHAQYHPDSLAALKADAAHGRGHPVDLSGYFNDARMGRDWQVPDPWRAGLDEEPPEPAAPPRLVRGFERHDMTFCLSLAQRGASCEVSLLADTARLPQPHIPRVLLGLEAVLRAAAQREVAMREVPALTGLPDDPTAPFVNPSEHP